MNNVDSINPFIKENGCCCNCLLTVDNMSVLRSQFTLLPHAAKSLCKENDFLKIVTIFPAVPDVPVVLFEVVQGPLNVGCLFSVTETCEYAVIIYYSF